MTAFDALEPRTLLASAFPNVNVSRTTGNHAEGTIVVDPTDASRLFVASNAPGTGLLAAVSSDGGATWARRMIADDPVGNTGRAADGLAPACCDPSASFDRFGNLYLTYARDADHGVDVVRSTDGGATFMPAGERLRVRRLAAFSLAGPDTLVAVGLGGATVVSAPVPRTPR